MGSLVHQILYGKEVGQHLFSKAGGKTGRCKGRATFGSFTVKMRGSTFSVKTQVLGGHDQKVQGKVNQLLYGQDAGQTKKKLISTFWVKMLVLGGNRQKTKIWCDRPTDSAADG